MIKQRLLSAACALGLLAAAPAFAQSNYATPWRGDFWGYIGASGGESKFRDGCRNVNVFSCDDRDTGFKVYAGGQFSPILGMEIGYTDFGRIRAFTGEVDAWAVPVVLTVGTPVANRFGIFGKVGGVYARTDVRVDLTDSIDERRDRNGFGLTYGVGATFAITPQVQLRADWDRYRMDFVGGNRDVDLLSAGLQVRF